MYDDVKVGDDIPCACRKAICSRMGVSGGVGGGVGSSPVMLSEFPVLIGSRALTNSVILALRCG
jgi:hypothetical protein